MLALPRRRRYGESFDAYMRYLDKCDTQSGILMIIGVVVLAFSAVASIEDYVLIEQRTAEVL